MTSKVRINEYKSKWREITEVYGNLCFYCRKEVATSLDHYVPYSYDQDSGVSNLVPACGLCNGLASNKHFETIEQKRQYILTQRAKRANAVAICTVCMLPFAYRIHSPSLFLCAECYDEEYGTCHSEKPEWKKWIYQLWAAGIPAEAHRIIRQRLRGVRDITRMVKVEMLVDEYAAYIVADDVFAERLIRS